MWRAIHVLRSYGLVSMHSGFHLVEASAAHIDYTILHCIFATMTSVTGFLTGNPGRATRNSAVSPRVTARGVIAHSSGS